VRVRVAADGDDDGIEFELPLDQFVTGAELDVLDLYLQDVGLQAIADELGVTVNSVAQRLNRILRKLRAADELEVRELADSGALGPA
jgi:DNA-binding CsgD family transcriptional regulator